MPVRHRFRLPRIDALRQARMTEDARLDAYVASLSSEELAASFDDATTGIMPQRRPRSEALAHLVNHQTHHRAQAHAIPT